MKKLPEGRDYSELEEYTAGFSRRERSSRGFFAKIVLGSGLLAVRRTESGISENQDAAVRPIGFLVRSMSALGRSRQKQENLLSTRAPVGETPTLLGDFWGG